MTTSSRVSPAERFDPDAWIRLFEQAGARYLMLTSKHHDGFALIGSATTRRDSVDIGPERDPVAELFEAADRAKDRVKPGAYYSPPEWSSPAPYRAQRHPVSQLLFPQQAPPNSRRSSAPSEAAPRSTTRSGTSTRVGLVITKSGPVGLLTPEQDNALQALFDAGILKDADTRGYNAYPQTRQPDPAAAG